MTRLEFLLLILAFLLAVNVILSLNTALGMS